MPNKYKLYTTYLLISKLVYSFYVGALQFLHMMCLYVLLTLYFDFGLNFLESKVFVLCLSLHLG